MCIRDRILNDSSQIDIVTTWKVLSCKHRTNFMTNFVIIFNGEYQTAVKVQSAVIMNHWPWQTNTTNPNTLTHTLSPPPETQSSISCPSPRTAFPYYVFRVLNIKLNLLDPEATISLYFLIRSILFYIGTVSYTHLDVYKRQI